MHSGRGLYLITWPFSGIQYRAKVIQTKLVEIYSFFIRANFPRNVDEFLKDVSSRSKRKIHDLSRKFAIAKFETANFRDMNRHERHR